MEKVIPRESYLSKSNCMLRGTDRGRCIWVGMTRSARLNCSRSAYGEDPVLHESPFSLHIRKDLVVNISFFLIFPQHWGMTFRDLC